MIILDSDPILGTVTDVDGYFTIKNVPIGRHHLQVTFIGYETQTVPELLVSSGKEVVLNLDLRESVEKLEELVVVADEQAKGQPRNELASVSSISISVEETSRYAATFDDPARAALSFAGVTTGGDDLLNEIVIRGNTPKGILWRMEGVEVPNPNHFASIGSSAGGVSMLSSNMLANSDFFTGAFTPQYGNATSGIFDLKMRQGNYDKPEHSIGAGLLGVAASSEGPLSKNSRASYLVNYRYSTLALLENLGLNILSDQEKISFQDLSFKFHVPTEKFGSFSLWGLGGRNTYTFKPNLEFGEVYYEEEIREMGVAGLTNVFFIGENTFVESVVSWSSTKYDYEADSLRQVVTFIENFDETSLRFSSFVNHKFNARHTVRVGGIYSRLGYDLYNLDFIREEDRFITSLDDDGAANFYQGYVNWQIRPSDRLTINTGLHGSYFEINKDLYLEPRFGLRWRVGDQFLTAGAGLHSRMETTAIYLARQEQQDGTFSQMNRDLEFTKAAHFVVGYEKQLKSDLRFKAEAYYQYLYDVPVWPNDTTSDAYLRTFSMLNTFDGYTSDELANDGEGVNYGIELTLEKFFTRDYYFLATASLYESLYRGADDMLRDTRFNGNFIFNALGGKEWHVGKNGKNTIALNGRFIWSGGKREAPILIPDSQSEGYTVYDFDRNFEHLLTNYYRIDFGFSYRKNKEKSAQILAINVQNVTAVENEFSRYYSPEASRVVTETQLSFFPNLSYKWEF